MTDKSFCEHIAVWRTKMFHHVLHYCHYTADIYSFLFINDHWNESWTQFLIIRQANTHTFCSGSLHFLCRSLQEDSIFSACFWNEIFASSIFGDVYKQIWLSCRCKIGNSFTSTKFCFANRSNKFVILFYHVPLQRLFSFVYWFDICFSPRNAHDIDVAARLLMRKCRSQLWHIRVFVGVSRQFLKYHSSYFTWAILNLFPKEEKTYISRWTKCDELF